MRIAFFDCFAGASGDMLLGALIDAGASETGLHQIISALHLGGCTARIETVMKGALSARQVSISAPQHETERHAAELIAILQKAELSDYVKRHALAIIQRLAEVEARAHNSSPDHVHLHELGGDDTLIDICGVLNALEELHVESVYVSSLPLTCGRTHSLHGLIPLPAPATLALLQDAPIRFIDDIESELVTPTGAALLTSLADGFVGFPPMRLKAVGVGAGTRNLPFPNVIRVLLGDAQPAEGKWAARAPQAVHHHHHDDDHHHDHNHHHDHDHHHHPDHHHEPEHAQVDQ